MKLIKFLSFLGLILVVLLFVFGCGDPTTKEEVPDGYFPLTQGRYWEYDRTVVWEKKYLINGVADWVQNKEYIEQAYAFVLDGENSNTDTVIMYEYIGEYEYETYSYWNTDAELTLYKTEKSWGETVYTPPVNYTETFSAGTQQDFSSEAHTTAGWGYSEVGTYSGTTYVSGEEWVATPAGTFKAIRVVIEIDDPVAKLNQGCSFSKRSTTVWFAWGVGKIKQVDRRTSTCRTYGGDEIAELVYADVVTKELTKYGQQ